MLTESFLAATLNPEKSSNATTLGIHVHDLQPRPALRSTLKKSSSNPKCVAVSRTHIFAAQDGKAIVHVYNRNRNNQEAIVPFPERIHSVALAGERDGAGLLVLGTEGGRVILWELGTGRQVSTPQHHLQAIKCLAVDLTSNFLLSGSLDSSIHVWSLPNLLSFSGPALSGHREDIPFSPLRSLSVHRSAVTALAFGHGASNNNIAVSTSKDGTCLIWDFANGTILHTYLLSNSPLCLVLDPADRALYVGYEDGSIQLIDFYKQPNSKSALHDPELRHVPSQPSEKDRWPSPPDSDASAIMALDISYDGTLLVSGHSNGKIHTWDIAIGRLQKVLVDFSAPVSNLIMLPPAGFPNEKEPSVTLQNIVKPRYETFANSGIPSDGPAVPLDYKFTAQFVSSISSPASYTQSSFQEALGHSSFPASFLEEAVAELGSFGHSNSPASEELRKQNAALWTQLEAVRSLQKNAEDALKERDQANWKRRQDEEIKAARKKRRRLSRIRPDEVPWKEYMGEPVGDVDKEMKSQDDDLSSSTDGE